GFFSVTLISQGFAFTNPLDGNSPQTLPLHQTLNFDLALATAPHRRYYVNGLHDSIMSTDFMIPSHKEFMVNRQDQDMLTWLARCSD
ncbi:hypothetical protein L195_g050729, partial [Trifolium pratense]